MAPVAGQKRKVEYNTPGAPPQARKRQKGKDARAIPTQTADAALSRTGELNIASFVKAREFEIAALQQSLRNSRKSLNQRAFQQVPRHMRRRTASHNVKKIPRRLRSRALREIKEDNTPTGSARKRKLSSKLRLRLETANKLQKLNVRRKSVQQSKRESKLNTGEPDPEKHVDIARVPRIKKNKLATPPRATTKFKRRQVNKTWLPTHLWHTKRAHMTLPTLPLWRMAIPLTPTEKSYRPTHRAAGSRGCIAWDASYISTIGCKGTESALECMLKALGYSNGNWTGSKYKKWKAGARFCEGWTFEMDQESKPIAPVTVLWQVKSVVQREAISPKPIGNQDNKENEDSTIAPQKRVKLDRQLFIRVHPAAFLQLWTVLLKAAKMAKPQVLVEDLRFEVGSIVVQGPQSTESLIGVMKLAADSGLFKEAWQVLPALSNPATLPLNAVLAPNIMDPRLYHPPRQMPFRCDDHSIQKLNDIMVSWPFDSVAPTSKLFDHKTRYGISKSLPSQKSINRRRSSLLPGQQVEVGEKDPLIPVILLAHRSSKSKSNMQGSWTVLLPWSCVDLVWRSLMYYPLSTGSTPRFGGLEQSRQVAFEQCTPWFPADFPGTEAGKVWDRTESENRFDEWVRRPPSKRLAWDALDLGLGRKGEVGRGWACDWEYLLKDSTAPAEQKKESCMIENTGHAPESTQTRLLTQRQRKAAAAAQVSIAEGVQNIRRNTSSPEPEGEPDDPHNHLKFHQLTPTEAASNLGSPQQAKLPTEPALATIRLKLLSRGTPAPAARIYRLPPRSSGNSSHKKALDSTSDRQQNKLSLPKPAPIFFADSPPDSMISLRQRWLDLDPEPFEQPNNPKSSTLLPKHEEAQKTNHSGDPTAHRVYDNQHTRDLSHIRVFPPRESNPEVLNMFGPRPPPRNEEEMLKVLQPQEIPKTIVNPEGDLVPEALWDKHIPCPEPEDLIGYVTSGAYNLVEGRGTAIGAIWAQRVITGWNKESNEPCEPKAGLHPEDPTSNPQKSTLNDPTVTHHQARNPNACPRSTTKAEAFQKKKAQKQRQYRIDRERHLCIVRNSGESVGRLAVWELC